MPRPHQLLTYRYVPDILERRGAYRDAHLALLADLHRAGVVVMAGAAGDPVDAAVFVFAGDDPQPVREFVAADPYVAAGLVVSHEIMPWTVVVP
jgi:uncharacterized protein YciI